MRAFSLIELVLALGVVSFALIAILGLIPVGMQAMRASVESTISTLIFQDVRERIRGTPMTNATLASIFYDTSGRYTETTSNALYRAEIRIAPPFNAPAHTRLMAVNIEIAWPTEHDGSLPTNNIRRAFSCYYVTPRTSPAWTNIDPAFVPQID